MPQPTRGSSRVVDERATLELAPTEGTGLNSNSGPVLNNENKEEMKDNVLPTGAGDAVKDISKTDVRGETGGSEHFGNDEIIENNNEHLKSDSVLSENKDEGKKDDENNLTNVCQNDTEKVDKKNIELMEDDIFKKIEKLPSLDSDSDVKVSKSIGKEESAHIETEGKNNDNNERRISPHGSPVGNKKKNNITEGVIGPYGVLRALNREEESFTPRYVMNDPDYLSLESYFIPMIPLYTIDSIDSKEVTEKNIDEMKGRNMLLVVPVINSKGEISYKLLREGRQRDAVIDALQGLSFALQRCWNDNDVNNTGSLIPQIKGKNTDVIDTNFETFQQHGSLDENSSGDSFGANKTRRNRKNTKSTQSCRGNTQSKSNENNTDNNVINQRNCLSGNVGNTYSNSVIIGKEYEGIYNGVVPGSKRIPTDVSNVGTNINNDRINNLNGERKNVRPENPSSGIDRPYVSTDGSGARIVGKLGPDQGNSEKVDTSHNIPNAISIPVAPPVTQTPSKPTKFSQFAISVLMNYFAIDNKPSPQKLTIIAEQTGLTRHQVRVWFQNKRARKDKQRKNNFQGSYITGVMQYSNVGNNITPNQAEKFNNLTNQEHMQINSGYGGPNVTSDKGTIQYQANQLNNNTPQIQNLGNKEFINVTSVNNGQQTESIKREQMGQELLHSSGSSVGINAQIIPPNSYGVSLNSHYNVSTESLGNQEQMINSRQQHVGRAKGIMVPHHNQQATIMTQQLQQSQFSQTGQIMQPQQNPQQITPVIQTQVSKSYTYQIQPQQVMSQTQLQHKNVSHYNTKMSINQSQNSQTMQPINNALLAISNTLPNGNSNKPVVIGTVSPTNIPGRPTQVTGSILETGSASQYHLSTNNPPILPIQTKIPSLFTQIQANDTQKAPSSFNIIRSDSFANAASQSHHLGDLTSGIKEQEANSLMINAQDALNNYVVDNAVGINKNNNYNKESKSNESLQSSTCKTDKDNNVVEEDIRDENVINNENNEHLVKAESSRGDITNDEVSKKETNSRNENPNVENTFNM